MTAYPAGGAGGREKTIETNHGAHRDRYQDYLYLHGLGVEMTEALAE
jgi:cobalamin-dependent methionine synthase I